MVKRVLPLTDKQIEFLRLVMQDYLDVTADSGIRRNAKAIMAKLDKISPTSTTRES